jgi:hypothetical protein
VGTVIYQQAAAEQAKQKAQTGQTGPTDQTSAPPGSSDEKVVDSEDYEVK